MKQEMSWEKRQGERPMIRPESWSVINANLVWPLRTTRNGLCAITLAACTLFSLADGVQSETALASAPRPSSLGTRTTMLSGKTKRLIDGANRFVVPINSPLDSAGMEPKLALVYQRGVGNGMLGPGWSFSGLSTIAICTQTKSMDEDRAAVYKSTTYCLDGQRLSLVAGSLGAPGSQYRSQIDSSSRITAHSQKGTGPAYFIVKTRSGSTIVYGSTADSQLVADENSSVSAWAVKTITNRKGNTTTFNSMNGMANGVLYPTSITYGVNLVSFSYDNSVVTAKDDLAHQGGSSIRTLYRMTGLTTRVGKSTVSRYSFNYVRGDSGGYELSSISQCDP